MAHTQKKSPHMCARPLTPLTAIRNKLCGTKSEKRAVRSPECPESCESCESCAMLSPVPCGAQSEEWAMWIPVTMSSMFNDPARPTEGYFINDEHNKPPCLP